jgi:hypothetical protein
MCLFCNITSNRDRLLLLMQHLTMHILTEKYLIWRQYTDCYIDIIKAYDTVVVRAAL